MIKIDKIKLENFQSHKETLIELYDGLNVILGSSDQGKSSIIRAIKWVLFNEPRGIDFIKVGEKVARVSILLNTGTEIIRERSKYKNRYILKNGGDNESVHEGFGNEVPNEILNSHKVKKVLVDNDYKINLNIQEQLENAFLMFESGNLKAKALNSMAGLHIIDRAFRDLATDVKKQNILEQKTKEEIENIDVRIIKYQYLKELEKNIYKYKNIMDILEKKKSTLGLISEFKKNLNYCYVEIETQRKLLNLIHKIGVIEKYFNNANEIKIKYINISNIRDKIKNNLIQENINSEILNKVKGVEGFDNTILELGKLVHKFQKANDIRERFNKIKSILNTTHEMLNIVSYTIENEKLSKEIIEKNRIFVEINKLFENKIEIDKSILDGEKFLNSKIQEVKTLTKDFIELLSKNKKCPICKSDISKEIIDNITNY